MATLRSCPLRAYVIFEIEVLIVAMEMRSGIYEQRIEPMPKQE